MDPYNEGRFAYIADMSISDNPYSPDTRSYLDWDAGWCGERAKDEAKEAEREHRADA